MTRSFDGEIEEEKVHVRLSISGETRGDAGPAGEIQEEEKVHVRLTVTGKQTDPDGNTQENTAVYRAECRNCGDGYLFSYPAEGTDVNLFLSRGSAWMQRGHNPDARMVFDPSGAVTRCDYETAYGVIPLEIRTEQISILAGGLRRDSYADKRKSGSENTLTHIFRSGRGLQARIRYALIMGPDYELSCSVTIKTQQIV